MKLQYDLREAKGDCKIEARRCLRISCWNTSGIYFCNVRWPPLLTESLFEDRC
jgi:hypothetical protein